MADAILSLADRYMLGTTDKVLAIFEEPSSPGPPETRWQLRSRSLFLARPLRRVRHTPLHLAVTAWP